MKNIHPKKFTTLILTGIVATGILTAPMYAQQEKGFSDETTAGLTDNKAPQNPVHTVGDPKRWCRWRWASGCAGWGWLRQGPA